jgi:hypothetical protein
MAYRYLKICYKAEVQVNIPLPEGISDEDIEGLVNAEEERSDHLERFWEVLKRTEERDDQGHWSEPSKPEESIFGLEVFPAESMEWTDI